MRYFLVVALVCFSSVAISEENQNERPRWNDHRGQIFIGNLCNVEIRESYFPNRTSADRPGVIMLEPNEGILNNHCREIKIIQNSSTLRDYLRPGKLPVTHIPVFTGSCKISGKYFDRIVPCNTP